MAEDMPESGLGPKSAVSPGPGFARANLAGWFMLATTIAVCLWPDVPNWALLLDAMALAAVTAAGIRFYNADLPPAFLKNDANSGIVLTPLFAPLALVLRALYRFKVIDWHWPTAVALILGLPAAWIFARTFNPRNGPVGRTVLALFLCYTGPGSLIWASLLFANAIADRPPTNTYHAVILDKILSRQSKSTSYYVKLRDPPAFNEGADFELSGETFGKVSIGDVICVDVWRGVLGIRWYRIDRCATGHF